MIATYLSADHPLDRRLQELVTRKMDLFVQSVDAAARTDDAPLSHMSFEVHERVKQIQEEIALGHAVRRTAKNEDEEGVIETLHTRRFCPGSDERIARQLAEESLVIGLSDKQWQLARDVAARGVERKSPQTADLRPQGEKSPDGETVRERCRSSWKDWDDEEIRRELEPFTGDRDGLVDVEGRDHLPECARTKDGTCDCGSVGSREEGEDEMAKVVSLLMKKIEGLSDTEQSVLFELLDGTAIDMPKVEGLKKEIEALPEKGKALLMELVQETLGEDEEDEESEEEEDES